MKSANHLLQKLCVLAALPLFVSACVSPKAVYRLQPVDENTVWLFGSEYVKISDDAVEVALAFDRVYSDYLVFDLEIANLTASPFLISPEAFRYTPLRSLADTLRQVTVFAVDPELQLLEVDKDISQENANYASAVVIDAAISVLDLFAHIATIGQEKSADDVAADAELHADMEISSLSRDHSHDSRLINLNAAREQWEFEALRSTTLEPGSKIQGKVFFPITKQARYLELALPIGDFEVTVLFKQHRHKV